MFNQIFEQTLFNCVLSLNNSLNNWPIAISTFGKNNFLNHVSVRRDPRLRPTSAMTARIANWCMRLAQPSLALSSPVYYSPIQPSVSSPRKDDS
jgi:uncharacterized membrane protein YdfJ with MMPL/SSD domain